MGACPDVILSLHKDRLAQQEMRFTSYTVKSTRRTTTATLIPMDDRYSSGQSYRAGGAAKATLLRSPRRYPLLAIQQREIKEQLVADGRIIQPKPGNGAIDTNATGRDVGCAACRTYGMTLTRFNVAIGKERLGYPTQKPLPSWNGSSVSSTPWRPCARPVLRLRHGHRRRAQAGAPLDRHRRDPPGDLIAEIPHGSDVPRHHVPGHRRAGRHRRRPPARAR